MKLLLPLVLVFTGYFIGLNKAPTKDPVEIIHDYQIEQAIRTCKNHEGFHYIVSTTKWDKNDEQNRHPCTQRFIVSCQNGYKETFDSEVAWCFISKSQIDESLEKLK